MNNQIQSATVFYLAAREHSYANNLKQAIRLYTKARVTFERCQGTMDGVIGLVCLELSECLMRAGEVESAERQYQKARSIMRSRGPIFAAELTAPAVVSESSIVH